MSPHSTSSNQEQEDIHAMEQQSKPEDAEHEQEEQEEPLGKPSSSSDDETRINVSNGGVGNDQQGEGESGGVGEGSQSRSSKDDEKEENQTSETVVAVAAVKEGEDKDSERTSTADFHSEQDPVPVQVVSGENQATKATAESSSSSSSGQMLVDFPRGDNNNEKATDKNHNTSSSELLVDFNNNQQDEAPAEWLQHTQPHKNHDPNPQADMTPLDVARKAAVGVAGGAMVGVGLVMIPLPTPFGAVIAGGGMAVLGSEFEGAKAMNEKVIDGMIKGIEQMDDGDDQDNTVGIAVEAQPISDSEESPDWLKAGKESNAGEPINEHQAQIKREALEQQLEKELPSNPLQRSRKAVSGFLSRNVLPFLRSAKGEYQQALATADEDDEGGDASHQSQHAKQYDMVDPEFIPRELPSNNEVLQLNTTATSSVSSLATTTTNNNPSTAQSQARQQSPTRQQPQQPASRTSPRTPQKSPSQKLQTQQKSLTSSSPSDSNTTTPPAKLPSGLGEIVSV